MIANLTKRLAEKLKRKDYRDEYVSEHVRTGVAYQIRALREQRGMRQGELATALGKPQSVVNRLEDPDYGRMSISTLLEVASAFDVALSVRYVSYPEFLRLNEDVSPDAMQVQSFDAEAFDIPPPIPSVGDVAISPIAAQVGGVITQQINPNVLTYLTGNLQLSLVANRGFGPMVSQTVIPAPRSLERELAERDRIIAEQGAELARLNAERRNAGNVAGMPTDVASLALKQNIGWDRSEIP